MTELALGRVAPPDFEHIAKYPIRALSVGQRPSVVPVINGTNWHRGMDSSSLITRSVGKRVEYWIAETADKTPIRGGHCYDFEPKTYTRSKALWLFYNQVSEGICVGEGCSQAMSVLNKRRYQPRWLYDRCKERDNLKGEGTFVRCGFDILRDLGHVRTKRGETHVLKSGILDSRIPVKADGIAANRWALSIEEIAEALGYETLPDAFDIMNSWGTNYPRRVKIPITLAHRLIFEQDGEAGIVTDL